MSEHMQTLFYWWDVLSKQLERSKQKQKNIQLFLRIHQMNES